MTLAIPVGMELVTAIGSLADKRHRLPDITTFVVHPDYLNRPYLYPRQATLLKVIFLDLEHMTEYDHRVIAEWEADYIASMDKDGVGNNGIVPGILERVRINRICPCGHDRGSHFVQGTTALDKVGTRCDECTDCHRYRGRRWFREVVSVIGRRGSKGHVGALATAYIIAHFIEMGNPQERYGIDRDKRLSAIVFAGKKEQAKANQWRDIVNVILGAPYFTPYISKPQAESLTIRSQSDLLSLREREGRGVHSEQDIATFEILPKESTTIAGRGQAGFLLIFDEAAHVVKGVANSPAEDVYDCLHPDTRILYSDDLSWRPIGEAKVGDLLMGLDEFPRQGAARKMREVKILDVRRSVSQPYRITFEDGSSVVCSDNHRWLRGWRNKEGQFNRWDWRSITPPTVESGNQCVRCGGSRLTRNGHRYLDGQKVMQVFVCRDCRKSFRLPLDQVKPNVREREGNPSALRVGDAIRWVADPWEDDDSREMGYLSGLFDGEGTRPSASRGFEVSFCQKEGEVLDYAKEILRDKGFPFRVGKQRKSGVRDVLVLGLPHVLRFLGQSKTRRLIQTHRDLWEGRRPTSKVKHKIIASIEPEGEPMELVDIETSEGTFIAEGLVSHNSSSPSLDQFGLDGFIYIPSSPWQKIGLLFDRYNLALEVEEDGSPVYPEMMMIQLTSWDIYKDWERSHEIPMVANRPTPFLHLKGAVQTYDEQMERLERANPETFRVERRSQFAAVLDAYLNPDRIAEIWQEDLPMLSKGTMTVSYRAHADPSTSGAAFAFAIGHRVDPDPKDTDALPMVVFDLIHSWKPEDYDDHQVPYLDITEELKGYLDGFMPAAMTFDQYNATGFIQALKQHVRHRRYPKRVQVYERPATHDLNWKTYETFKTAVGLGLVKAPFHEDANAELTFLQLVGNKRVDHPDAGPVQRKDIADCLAIITYELIGDSIAGFVGKTMGELSVLGAMQGGVDAAGRFAEDAHERMSQFGRTRSSRIKRG